ncbi:MAG: methylated-DNA--[protein]-cysteine S-methyltransferase [Planctomycetes bacterium]|nr:methylated-DNA--[protein]-cysteine S-methyltransferase [Planctomycetota bacterium]
MVKYTAIAAPLGSVGFVASEEGLREVFMTRRGVDRCLDWLRRRYPGGQRERGLLATFQEQLRDYLAGRPVRFDVRVDLGGLTEFQQQVLAACAEVDYGKTATYGELARRIGRPRAARAVGAALGRNPVPLVVPCHRIVGCDGALVGFSAEQGLRVKRWLLELEAKGKAGVGNTTPGLGPIPKP